MVVTYVWRSMCLNRRISCIHPDAQLQVRPPGGQRVQAALGAPGKVAAQIRLGVLALATLEAGQVGDLTVASPATAGPSNSKHSPRQIRAFACRAATHKYSSRAVARLADLMFGRVPKSRRLVDNRATGRLVIAAYVGGCDCCMRYPDSGAFQPCPFCALCD